MLKLTHKYKAILDKLKPAFMHDIKETGGTNCPCCGQYAKVYKRKLNSAAAIGLIRLYKLGKGYHHVSKLGISGSGGSFALLRHWGLIEAKENEDDGKRCSGLWRITKSGIDFVTDMTFAHEYVILYNNNIIDYDGEIGIKRALGNKFDYYELMGCK